MNGIERIAAERKRQIEVEGWTAEHDSDHVNEELVKAAVCYANAAPDDRRVPTDWPWDRQWFKLPQKGTDYVVARIRLLEKAGALMAAEIDRLVAIVEEDEET